MKPGMVTEADVYDDDNNLLVPRRTALTDKLISRLKYYEVDVIDVLGEGAFVKAPVIDDETYKKNSYFGNFRKTKEFVEYKARFDESASELKGQINSIIEENAPIDTDEMLHMVGNLLDMAEDKHSVYDMLHAMRDYDDESFAHMINVSLICTVFARWMKMGPEDTELLTLCGLFHDIGKAQTPLEILKKKGPLTQEERELIQQHTLKGFQILKKANVDTHIQNAALLHHERFDGSGYPLKLRQNNIDPFARMVAIADVYDAVTSPRSYRDAMCPFQAIEIFEDEGLQKYDTRMIMVFLQNVVNTYIQRPVKLSDGREVRIVEIHPDWYSKPLVETQSGKFFDMRDKELRKLHIVEIL